MTGCGYSTTAHRTRDEGRRHVAATATGCPGAEEKGSSACFDCAKNSASAGEVNGEERAVATAVAPGGSDYHVFGRGSSASAGRAGALDDACSSTAVDSVVFTRSPVHRGSSTGALFAAD